MRRREFALKGTADLAKLQSFIVFDGVIPPGEGSQPMVYFARCPEGADGHFAVNLAGVFITFCKFCTHFTKASPCDYVATRTHEFALLELCDDIWMVVQREVSASPNRNLLLSMLHSCKSIYELFFQLPQRIAGTGQLTRRSIALLSTAFEMIVNSVTWTDLAFIQLFDSFLQLRPNADFSSSLERIVCAITSNTAVPIAHVAVLHSRYFLHSTFPLEVSRAISIAMSIKFPYLFPHVLAKQEARMYWIIGLSRGANGAMTLHAPPIKLRGELYPLVALRMLKLRIVIALRPNCLITPEVLELIPPLLAPLRHTLRARASTRAGEDQRTLCCREERAGGQETRPQP
jgi:hypothetical protein